MNTDKIGFWPDPLWRDALRGNWGVKRQAGPVHACFFPHAASKPTGTSQRETLVLVPPCVVSSLPIKPGLGGRLQNPLRWRLWPVLHRESSGVKPSVLPSQPDATYPGSGNACRRSSGAGAVPFGRPPLARRETRRAAGFSGRQTASRPAAIDFGSASLRSTPLSIAPTFPVPPGPRQ